MNKKIAKRKYHLLFKDFFQILHFVSIREIPAKISSDIHVTTKIGNYLRKEFSSASKVKQLIKEDRVTQLKRIYKLKTHIPNLLYYLFNVHEQTKEDATKLLNEMTI